MALEAYRIILLIGVFSVGCNGIIRAPVLDKVQKIAADSSDNVKDHNLNRTQTCPQNCRCVWFENDSSFQSISCFLANVTQDNELDFPSNSLSSCEAVFNTSEVAFYYLETLNITGCTSFTNLTKSSFPTGYSITHLKLSYGGLEHVEANSLSAFGSILEHLDFAHNEISYLPVEFCQSLTNLKTFDLSGNKFVQFDVSPLHHVSELKIEHSPYLESLEFTQNQLTQLKTFSAKNSSKLSQFCPWIIWSSPLLHTLDLVSCPQLLLPHRIFKTNSNLKVINIDTVTCDCLPPVAADEKRHCENKSGEKQEVDRFRQDNCYQNSDGENQTNVTNPVFQALSLNCDLDVGDDFENFVWIGPLGTIQFQSMPSNYNESKCSRQDVIVKDKCMKLRFRAISEFSETQVFDNGTLTIKDFGWSDRGRYECLAYDELGRFKSVFTNVFLEPQYRTNLYYLSLVWGFSTAGGFLLLTLFSKLIHFVLHNYGCCLFCCCCKDQLPPKAQRLESAIESIEAYRGQQLGKLQENYAEQSDWIRQNCAVQMEKVRENYNWQVQNLRDIRHYSSNQVGAVRDQYFDQMSRIREYSTSQLQRVHENYYFQRQKLRKFNTQNYLKMRETRQYTRRTLQKVMENLPALYLDLTTCRQGMGERQNSLEWNPNIDPSQILELEMYHQIRMQQLGDRHSESLYFTPSGTPMREMPEPPLSALSVKSNSFSNDSNAYSAVYAGSGQIHQAGKTHQRVKSFSHFLPGWFNNTKEVQVEVVVEQNKDDYYDVNFDKKTESPETEQLLTSYMDGNNECHLEMTDDQSSSGKSSSEKKVISDTITSSSKTSTSMSSKKTLMTNLSGLKSEIDLSTQQLLLVPESRRKSL